ncbi:MAG: SDR family oxidoreductase [Kofleriaceae bacterium]
MNILITGTSTGFGKLTALSLAGRGHRVFATMRDPGGKNAKHAEALRAPNIDVLELDVTNEASVDAAVSNALASAGHLDAVVNNAGQARIGLTETITPGQLAALLDINVVGIQRVNRAVLPSMRARKSGLVILVSSGLGRIVMPVVGLYAATKAAVEAFGDIYRYDLKPTGVDVTVVQPGAYPTEFGSGPDTVGADQDRALGYGSNATALPDFVAWAQSMKAAPNPANPQDVADGIVKLIEMAPGTRPARVSIDRTGAPFTAKLNDAHAEVQRQLLAAVGKPHLAD